MYKLIALKQTDITQPKQKTSIVKKSWNTLYFFSFITMLFPYALPTLLASTVDSDSDKSKQSPSHFLQQTYPRDPISGKPKWGTTKLFENVHTKFWAQNKAPQESNCFDAVIHSLVQTNKIPKQKIENMYNKVTKIYKGPGQFSESNQIKADQIVLKTLCDEASKHTPESTLPSTQNDIVIILGHTPQDPPNSHQRILHAGISNKNKLLNWGPHGLKNKLYSHYINGYRQVGMKVTAIWFCPIQSLKSSEL